jgi:hypothetical protein
MCDTDFQIKHGQEISNLNRNVWYYGNDNYEVVENEYSRYDLWKYDKLHKDWAKNNKQG